MDTKQAIGGGLAVILLTIYASLVFYAVYLVLGHEAPSAGQFTGNMASAVATIGALVAALVVAELAVTPLGESPGIRVFASAKKEPGRPSKWITWIFLLVWVATGLTALVVGTLLPSDATHPLPPLSDLGQAWFGVAIAAGYSYLGIQPKISS